MPITTDHVSFNNKCPQSVIIIIACYYKTIFAGWICVRCSMVTMHRTCYIITLTYRFVMTRTIECVTVFTKSKKTLTHNYRYYSSRKVNFMSSRWMVLTWCTLEANLDANQVGQYIFAILEKYTSTFLLIPCLTPDADVLWYFCGCNWKDNHSPKSQTPFMYFMNAFIIVMYAFLTRSPVHMPIHPSTQLWIHNWFHTSWGK